MAIAPEVARYLGRKYGRRLVGDYDPEDPLGDAKPAPVATPQDSGDELATPEEMRPPAPPVPGGLKVSDGPDMEPDGDPDDSAHLAMLATASRPPLRTAPTPDESWGTYGDAKGLSAARASDRDSMLATMLQRAGRQVISGLTRTPEAETIAAPADAEKRYLGAQAAKREAMLKALKDAREGRVADADVELKLAETEKARRLPMAPAAKPGEAPWHEELARANLDLRKKELDALGGRRAAGAAEKAKKEAVAVASASMPFDDGSLDPKPGTSVGQGIEKLREHAGLYNAALGAMDDYIGSLKAFVTHPSPGLRSEVLAKASTVGGAMNTANGQGAMSKDEHTQRMSDLGAPGATSDTIAALIDKGLGNDEAAAQAMLRRAMAARAAVKAAGIAKFKPSNYEFHGKAAAASGGEEKVVVSNGKETVRIPAARLKDAERDGFRRIQ